MKHTFFILVLLVSSVLSFAQGDVNKHSITINKFENKEFNEFNRDEKVKITKEIVKVGFLLSISPDITTNNLEVLNDEGNYIIYPPDNPSKLTGFTTYTLINQHISIDNKILIKIVNGENEAFITLNVEASNNGGQGNEVESMCLDLFNMDIKSSDCNENKEFFGESADNFIDNTIVYVYDYNIDPSKRVFHKITKNKKSGNLERNIVNLNKETLTTRKNVRFKIYDINKFIYNVSIADSLVQFESEPPTLFNEFFLGDEDGLLGTLIQTFSKGYVSEKSFNDYNAKTLINNISCFIKNYNTLRGIAVDVYNPCKTFYCCNNINYADFLTMLSQIKSQTKIVVDKLDTAKITLQKMTSKNPACFNQMRLKTSIEINIKNADFSISKFDLLINQLTLLDASLKNQIDKIQLEIKSIESQMYFSSGADSLTKKAQLLRLEKELSEKRVEFTANNTKFHDQQKTRLDKEIERNKLINSLDSVKIEISRTCETSTQKVLNEIEEMIYSLETSKYLLNNLPSEKDLKDLIIFVNNIVAQNYIHTKDYISLNGNMLDLTLSISSKDSSEVKKLTNIKVDVHLPIQIPIIWKPFVSFSTGSFMTIGSNIQNKTYAWKETVGNNNTANPDSYTLVESGYTSPPMGFSALSNLQCKLSRSIGFGGSAGVGLTIEKSPRLAYLGGVSLFFGDLRQLVITGGFAGMQVNKLTNNFQSITDNQIIYTSKPDIQNYNEFKVGGFISLTYTPFKVYKTKTVKSKNK